MIDFALELKDVLVLIATIHGDVFYKVISYLQQLKMHEIDQSEIGERREGWLRYLFVFACFHTSHRFIWGAVWNLKKCNRIKGAQCFGKITTLPEYI